MQQFLEMQQDTPTACIVDIIPPTGGVISSLTNNPDGSIRAQWSAAADSTPPFSYEVFVQRTTATGLFSVIPFISRNLFLDIYRDSLGFPFITGEAVHVGVRPVDAVGNVNLQSISLSIIATGSDLSTLFNLIPLTQIQGTVSSSRVVGYVESLSVI